MKTLGIMKGVRNWQAWSMEKSSTRLDAGASGVCSVPLLEAHVDSAIDQPSGQLGSDSSGEGSSAGLREAVGPHCGVGLQPAARFSGLLCAAGPSSRLKTAAG